MSSAVVSCGLSRRKNGFLSQVGQHAKTKNAPPLKRRTSWRARGRHMHLSGWKCDRVGGCCALVRV